MEDNSCKVVSIEGFSVSCISTDATTPTSANGSVSVIVQGGTPPYTYNWAHGPVGTSTLENLLPGEYTVTVSDFYGDNVEVVTCVVSSEIEYEDKFELCVASNTELLYSLRDVVTNEYITFEVNGSEIYNIPSVGDVVKIISLGSVPLSAGLMEGCCYERVIYDETYQIIGYFGSSESTKVVFSTPSACDQSLRTVKKIINGSKLNLISEKKNIIQDLTKSQNNYKTLSLDKTIFREIKDTKPDLFKLDIPILGRTETEEYELEKFQPFPSNINVGVTNGVNRVIQQIKPSVTCYRMRDKKGGGVGTMVFNGDKMYSIIRSKGKQMSIEKYNNDDYVLFDFNDLKTSPPPFACGFINNKNLIKNDDDQKIIFKKSVNETCTTIALDVHNSIFNDFNQDPNQVTDFVLGLMSVTSDIYYEQTNGQRIIQIGHIEIWSQTPPYSLSSGESYLEGIANFWKTTPYLQIPRDILHHLSLTTPGGYKGLAYPPGALEVACSIFLHYSYSRLSVTTNDVDVNNYATYRTYDIKTICHELGHNFGSPHTHSCGEWGYSNNVPIILDSCGICTGLSDDCCYGIACSSCQEGSNYIVDPSYQGYGTIMSYCSESNVGSQLVFNSRVINEIFIPGITESDKCLSSCDDGTTPPPPPPPVDDTECSGNRAVYAQISNSIFAILNITPVLGKVYEFAELEGRYEYVGKHPLYGPVLNLTVIGTLDGCPTDTDPPTEVFYQLCLTDNVSVQYTFEPGPFDANTNQTWVNSENGLTISYNISSSRWEVTPWNNVGIGQMVQFLNQPVPIGSWNNIGGPSGLNWSVNYGECTTIPLNITSIPSPENCVGEGNGSVQLQGSGGVPGYTYMIEGVPPNTFVSGGLFNGLFAGTYIGIVKDSLGNTASTQFVIQNGSNSQIYSLNISQNITQQGSNFNTVYKGGTFNVTVNPTLLQNTTISFKIVGSVNYVEDNTGNVTFNSTFNVKKNNYPIEVIQSQVITSQSPYCDNQYIRYNRSFTFTSGLITMSVTDYISGDFYYSFDFNEVSESCNCPTDLSATLAISLSDITIDGGSCAQVIQNVNQPSSNISGVRCDEPPTPTPTPTMTPSMTRTPLPTPPPTGTPRSTPDPTPTPTSTPRPMGDCDSIYYFDESGPEYKRLYFDIEVGEGSGQYGILYNVLNSPKRFVINYNGTTVADSGWVGSQSSVISSGLFTYYSYPNYTIQGENVMYYGSGQSPIEYPIFSSSYNFGSDTGILDFQKPFGSPTYFTVIIYKNPKVNEFQFTLDPICNDLLPTPSPTPTNTVTPTHTPTPTPSQTPPIPPVLCVEDALESLNYNGAGIFDIEYDMGTETGMVYFQLDAQDVPDRFQVIWNGNIVCDTLFIGDFLSGAFEQIFGTLYTNEIINNQLTLPYYNWYSTINAFVATGENEIVTYNINDIAPSNITRGNSSSDNTGQIGVDQTYPNPDVAASFGEVQVSFNKNSELPSTVTLRIIGAISSTNTQFSVNAISCPGETLIEYVYFTLEAVCDFTDSPINPNTVFRANTNTGISNGLYMLLSLGTISDGPYKIVTTQIETTNDIGNFYGLYATPGEAVADSKTLYNIGCRANYRSCCDGTSGTGGPEINFNVNLGILYDEMSDVRYINGTPISCVSKNPRDPLVSYDIQLENTYYGPGSYAEIDCLQERCLRCTRIVRLCGDDSGMVIKWIFEPNAAYDYSIGKFFYDDGLVDFGFSSSCFVIVDPSTPFEDTYNGANYNHNPIGDCTACGGDLTNYFATKCVSSGGVQGSAILSVSGGAGTYLDSNGDCWETLSETTDSPTVTIVEGPLADGCTDPNCYSGGQP